MDRAINIIGVASVVGSLIFVGLELRQSQQIALADQVEARLEKTLDRNRTWFEGQRELGYKIATTPYEELSDPPRPSAAQAPALEARDTHLRASPAF